MKTFDARFVFSPPPAGPLPSAMKVRGGSPYSHYEILGSDSLGIPAQGTADNWHRTPGSKMGSKPATSSWPPGQHVCPQSEHLFPYLLWGGGGGGG